jgi:hypothetical protein
MLEAASTSETSVNFYHTTRHNIPEECHLHIVSWFYEMDVVGKQVAEFATGIKKRAIFAP